jgi:hypothetical protein
MSVTFSSKFGSLDILKRRTRCGFKPASAQIRPTLEGLIPISAAIELRLQCVALGGNSLAVLDRTLCFTAGDSGFLPGGRVLSRNKPSTPSAM